jgi:hypothetical protein
MFRRLPPFGGDQRAVAEIVNGIMDGKTNNTGTVTLATSNATTTTITDARIGIDSTILLVPSSDAAEADALPYGEFICTAGQTAASANTAYAMGMNTTVISNGIDLVSTTNITVKNDGVYNLSFSMQFENQDNNFHSVNVWFKKNNTDIAYSNRIITVPARKSAGNYGHVVAQISLIEELEADDYLTAYWSTESTQVILQATGTQTSPTRPATPCKVASISYIAPLSSGSVYISSQTNGSAVVSHFSNDTANKTYKYVIVG